MDMYCPPPREFHQGDLFGLVFFSLAPKAFEMNYSTFIFLFLVFSVKSLVTNQLNWDFSKRSSLHPTGWLPSFAIPYTSAALGIFLATNCPPPTFPSSFIHFFIFLSVLSLIKPPLEMTRGLNRPRLVAALPWPRHPLLPCSVTIWDTGEGKAVVWLPRFPSIGCGRLSAALMKRVKYNSCFAIPNLLLCFFSLPCLLYIRVLILAIMMASWSE